MKNVALILFASLAVVGVSQEQSRREIVQRADDYARKLGAKQRIGDDAYIEDFAKGQAWRVQGDEVSVTVNRDLSFGYFSDASREARITGSSEERYTTGEAAVAHVRQRLEDVGLSADQPIKRTKNGVGVDSSNLLVFLGPSPYGYETSRNETFLQIHRVTGLIISLGRGPTWAFEPPNIRVTQAEAVQRARDMLGGETRDWRSTLRYETITDKVTGMPSLRSLNERRIARLCYRVGSDRGHILVDSVTGEAADLNLRADVPQASDGVSPDKAQKRKRAQACRHGRFRFSWPQPF